MHGEISTPPPGEGFSSKEEGDKNGVKPPSSPQNSCFSTILMQYACVGIPSEKDDGQVCTFFPHDVEDEVQ